MASKVAVVTGANRGIGFAIVRGLCKRFEGAVYLTSRDVERGTKAVEDLKKEGLNPKYHQLDVTDKKSLETFRDYLKKNYGGLDLLVNNVGIAFKHDAPDPVIVQATETLHINYYCLLSACDVFFPILKNGAKVVNLTSSTGHLDNLPSVELRKRFLNTKTVEEVSALLQEYVDECKKGTQLEKWGDSSYVVSKVGVTAVTFVQQKLLADKGIVVNAVHPGYVDTELTSHRGPLTIDQGAEAPLYAALDLNESLKGQYVWCTKLHLDWDGVRPTKH